MASSYEDAVRALYQAAHGEFVEVRKRLAGELKASGDKTGAAQLAKLPRPPVSAWAVNHLWWQARDGFVTLFESAARVRAGDLSATAAHRDALAKLRQQAAKLLAESGHGTAEATLRKVSATLSSLAAAGGFAPDLDGALGADRDPPGFETMGIASPSVAAEPGPVVATSKRAAPRLEPAAARPDADTTNAEHARQLADQAATKRAAEQAAATKRAAEQAAAKRAAAVAAAEASVATARNELARKHKELERLRKAVDGAQAAVDKAQQAVDAAEHELAQLGR